MSFLEGGYFYFDKNTVKHCGFLSNSIIFVILNDNKSFLLHTSEAFLGEKKENEEFL